MRVLLVDDDKEFVATLADELQQHFAVDTVMTGREGVYQATVVAYDVVVLDIGLPDLDGLGVCRELRAKGEQTPILMLTARHAVAQKVLALNAGADDYLTKPFTFDELLARVRALLRRPRDTMIVNPIVVGDLSIDLLSRVVKRGETAVELRRKEFGLLEYLVRNQGRVVTRGMILEHVWNAEIDPLSNTVDVHINSLRSKIDRPFRMTTIKTVPGVGYKFEA